MHRYFCFKISHPKKYVLKLVFNLEWLFTSFDVRLLLDHVQNEKKNRGVFSSVFTKQTPADYETPDPPVANRIEKSLKPIKIDPKGVENLLISRKSKSTKPKVQTRFPTKFTINALKVWHQSSPSFSKNPLIAANCLKTGHRCQYLRKETNTLQRIIVPSP